MNEVQTIRREIAAQRLGASEIAARCAPSRGDAGLAENYNLESIAYEHYMFFFLDIECRRLAAHLDRLRTGVSDESARLLLERGARVLAEARTARDSLRRFVEASDPLRDAAPSAPDVAADRSVALREAGERVRALEPVAAAIEACAAKIYRLEDWRRAAHLDADVILEERRLRNRILELEHARRAEQARRIDPAPPLPG